MKSIKLLLFILTVTIPLFTTCNKGEGTKSKQGEQTYKTAPQLSGVNILDATHINLSDYQGNVVFVNFWATWCPPCRIEIPAFTRLQKEFHGRFTVIGISLDNATVDIVRNFANQIHINYPIIMGNEEIVESFGGIQVIPTTFVVNGKGKIVTRFEGARSYEYFKRLIEQNL